MVEQSESRLLNLFQHLSEDLNESTGNDASQFAQERLQCRMRKRALIDRPGLPEKALESFMDTNVRMGKSWGSYSLDPDVEENARCFIREAFERFNSRRDPELIQIPYDPRLLNDYWRFGPGASVEVTGTHFSSKIEQPMSCTSLAESAVKQLRWNNHHIALADMQDPDGGTHVVAGSRLTMIPKNEEAMRTIATEPSGNMALQLALGCYIQDVLKSIGLDIQTQEPKNKALAKAGSINDGLATIDLKAASDSISIRLCKALLPPEIYDACLRFRCGHTELPDGSNIKLNMMSTMGNGFTFPLMTLIFVSLIYGLRLEEGGPRNYIDWSKTAVYGDDIIVPTDEVERLIEVLNGAGFIVNEDKSFLSGPFRESCGGDYWNGIDVTPFYIEELVTDAHVYVAINKVFEWSSRHGLLWHTLAYLKTLLTGEVLFVPEWHGNDAGFRTPQCCRRYKYLRPYQDALVYQGKFLLMVAIGGYVTSGARVISSGPIDGLEACISVFPSTGAPAYYVPRSKFRKYKVRKMRIPKGYLDGSDPLSRTEQTSTYISNYSWLLES